MQATQMLGPWRDPPLHAQPRIRHQRIPPGCTPRHMCFLTLPPAWKPLADAPRYRPLYCGHPLTPRPPHLSLWHPSIKAKPPPLASAPGHLGWHRVPRVAQGPGMAESPQDGIGFPRVTQAFPGWQQGPQGGTGSPGVWHSPAEPPQPPLPCPLRAQGAGHVPRVPPQPALPPTPIRGSVPGLLPVPAPCRHPRRSTLRSPTRARPLAQDPPRGLASPSLPGQAWAWAQARARPSLRCPPQACQSLPARDASPRAGWHACLPRDSGMRSLPCPGGVAAGAMPTSSFPENLGCCRVPLGRRSSQTDGHHHPASSAPLPPASKIRPRQRWVSGEVLSLRACCQQRSAAAHGTHVQQHPRLAKGSFSCRGTDPCQPPLSRTAPQNPTPYPDWARAVRVQAEGWHCQPHSPVTPVPPPRAHSHQLVRVPIQWRQLAQTVASPLRAPAAPQAGTGTLRGAGLTLAWHLVWQESLQPAGGRGERGSVGAGEGARPGAARTCAWMPAPCTRACAL